MARKLKERVKKKDPAKIIDFAALLDLPERLAIYLRLWFHISKGDWDFMVDKVRQGKPYKEWSKSKGKGKGRRYFAAPCDELKKVQKAISNQFLSQIPVHFSRHGGVKGSSIITNAAYHLEVANNPRAFAVDIMDAYPSVFRSRIRACLKKPFGFILRQFKGVELTNKDKEQLLETIVDLLAWKDRLPQGPPTSPQIFAIVCGKVDQEIFELAQKNSTIFQNYRLSIYADNIVISSDEEIPQEIRDEVIEIIKRNGFRPHTRKDKMFYYSPKTGTVPVITGLILTEGRVLMHPDKVNQIRGKLHRLLKPEVLDGNEMGEVAGLLGFVRQIYPIGKNLPAKLKKVVEQAEIKIQVLRAATSSATKKQQGKTLEKKTAKVISFTKVPKAKSNKNNKLGDVPFVVNG